MAAKRKLSVVPKATARNDYVAHPLNEIILLFDIKFANIFGITSVE